MNCFWMMDSQPAVMNLVLLQGLRLHMAYADADRPGSRLAFRHLLGGVISRVVPACVNKQ